MILPIVKFGHPVLRQKGAAIEKITPEIKQLIADMFETMRERHGVGLAAQQIGKALQLTVIDVRRSRPAERRPSTLELKGKPADVRPTSCTAGAHQSRRQSAGGRTGDGRKRRLFKFPGNFCGNFPSRIRGGEGV